MFKTMKQGFGWAVGCTAGLACMKFAAELILSALGGKETKGKHEAD